MPASGLMQGAQIIPALHVPCFKKALALGSASIAGMSAIVMQPPPLPTPDSHAWSGLPPAARTSSGTHTWLASPHGPSISACGVFVLS